MEQAIVDLDQLVSEHFGKSGAAEALAAVQNWKQEVDRDELLIAGLAYELYLFGLLGNHEAADDLVAQFHETAAQSVSWTRHRWTIATALARSAHGASSARQGEVEAAIESLDDVGDLRWFSMGLVNRVGMLLERGAFESAVRAANEALAAVEKVPSTDRWFENRIRCGALTNRGLSRLMTHHVEDGVSDLLQARKIAQDEQLVDLFGVIDLNLAFIYVREERFVSARAAAATAVRALAEMQESVNLARARVALAVAELGLGNLEEADQALCMVDIENLVHANEQLARNEYFAALAAVARASGDTDSSDQVEGERRALEGPIEQWLDEFLNLWCESMDEPSAEKTCDVVRRMEQMAVELPNHEVWRGAEFRLPEVVALSEVFPMLQRLALSISRCLTTGRIDPAEMQGLAVAVEEQFRSTLDPEWLGRVVEQFSALARRDRPMLLAHSANQMHDLAARLRSEPSLAGRGQALEIGTRFEFWLLANEAVHSPVSGLLAELIESRRSDLSELADQQVWSDLPEHSELQNSKSEPASTLRMPEPPVLSVHGRSRFGNWLGRPARLDLAEVQSRLAPDGSWLAYTLLDDQLLWSFIDRRGGAEGTIRIDSHLQKAFRQLRQLHTFVTPREANAGEWASTIATARAASHPFVGLPAKSAIWREMLPAGFLDSSDASSLSPTIDLDWLFSELGTALLPMLPLNKILSSGSNHPLLVTLPPELSTVPLGLLKVPGTKDRLQDVASLRVAPPVGLLSTSASSMEAGQLAPLLRIVDPDGSLQLDADVGPEWAYDLRSLEAAQSLDQVATREQIFHSLLEVSSRARGGLFCYLGHMEPGSSKRPGSAALLAARRSALDPIARVTAEDLFLLSSPVPEVVYLGSCEGTGFGTGLEWFGIGSALMSRGARVIVAHAWPIIQNRAAMRIDQRVVNRLIDGAASPIESIREVQREECSRWEAGEADAITPHFWAGLQVIVN